MSKIIGIKIFHYAEIESTNKTALSGEFSGEPTGSVIVADIQKAGLGRVNRSWLSPKGGLYFTVLFHGERNTTEYNKLAVLFSHAIRNQLVEYAPHRSFFLKWPNDIFADTQKICGILTQAVTQGEISKVAIGIGINLNSSSSDYPKMPYNKIATLFELTGKKVDIPNFLDKLLNRLDSLYQDFREGEFEKHLPEINASLYKKSEIAEFMVNGELHNYRIIKVNSDSTLKVLDKQMNLLDLNIGEIG